MAIDLDSVLPLSGGTLTLGPTSASGPVLGDQLARTTNGAPITIRNAARSVADGVVTVTGQADFLNVAGAPVTVMARAGSDSGVGLLARFTLIEGAPAVPPWKFSRSFPNLPPFATGQRADKSRASGSPRLPNTLDTLILSDAAFVLSTAEQASDPVTGAPLQPGLNFVGRIVPTGLLGLVETILTGGERLKIYGRIVIPTATEATVPLPSSYLVRFPWQLPNQPPGILLRADAPLDIKVGSALRLHNGCTRIYCATSKAWADANPTFNPYLAISADLDIPSAQISVELTALGLSSDYLSLIGVFDGVTLGKLEHLVDLAGGKDLATVLPEDVRSAASVLEGLELRSISLDLGEGWRPVAAGASVALPNLNTKVLPGFQIDSLIAGFNISDPFGASRAVSVMLGGHIQFAGAPLDVAVELPDLFATARTTDTISIPISTLVRETGLAAPDMPDLPINELQMEIADDGSFGVFATIAQVPPWTLDLGPTSLTVKNVMIAVLHPSDQAVTGQVSGAIAFGNVFTLAVNYQTPGSFTMKAVLPEVHLLQLIEQLTNQDIPIPGGFDLNLIDSSVLIQKTGATNLVFQLATTIEHIGTIAFEARRVGGTAWGFAAGIDIQGARFSSLPGLGALKPFEDFFRLDQLTLVAASFDDANFQFPGLAAFAAPRLSTARLAMPAGGVIAGFNIAAQWTLDTSKEQHLLQQFLGLQSRLGITLQIGRVPSQDSRLYVSYATTIKGMPFSCQFGGQIKGSQISLFLKGNLAAKIQGRPVDFQVEMMLVANGAFFSGSMLGAITFEGLTLSNVALVIGCNWEGIPSLGVACSLAVKRFSSALAVFFDSTDPSRSMLAGSVSDLKLKDVVETLTNTRLPRELDQIASQVALLHTKEFSIDGALSDDLDNLKLDRVAAAFGTNGVSLSTNARDVLVVVGQKGKTWFITNMLDNMMHYELMKSGNSIKVMLNPQFYCIPQTTALGALKFEQGFFLTARLKVLVLDAQATVLVKPTKGILVDGEMDKIVIWKEQLFSVSSADGKRGARLSVATFSQPEIKDPVLRGPHFLIDGQISLLGLSRHAFVTISEKGFRFDIGGDIYPAFNVDLKGQFGNLSDFSAGGAMKIGVGNVDLGPLGHANIATGAHASLDSGFKGTVWAKIAGGFEFAGQQFNIPSFDLDLNQGLLKLPKRITDEVIAALKRFFTDVGRWAEMVGRGVLTGVTDMANTLKNVFHVGAEDAAKLMRTAKQAADTVANGLKTAYGASADQAARMMRGAGFAANEVANGLKSAFNATADQAAKILRGAGFAANEVGNALKSAYGATADQVAKWLRGAGYAANEVAGALKSAFNVSVDQAAKLLQHAGYAANDVGNALKSAYNASADVAAKALKGAGYAVDQVGNVMKSAYGVAADQVDNVLKGAGYAAKEVDKFFGKAGDEIKKAGEKLDPTKW